MRNDIEIMDKEITKVMTKQARVLWQGKFWGGSEQNIIGYGNYTDKRPKGDVEWFVVGLAVQKNYISIYINAVEDNQYLVEKHANTLYHLSMIKNLEQIEE